LLQLLVCVTVAKFIASSVRRLLMAAPRPFAIISSG